MTPRRGAPHASERTLCLTRSGARDLSLDRSSTLVEMRPALVNGPGSPYRSPSQVSEPTASTTKRLLRPADESTVGHRLADDVLLLVAENDVLPNIRGMDEAAQRAELGAFSQFKAR